MNNCMATTCHACGRTKNDHRKPGTAELRCPDGTFWFTVISAPCADGAHPGCMCACHTIQDAA